jgi:hypothetical protein
MVCPKYEKMLLSDVTGELDDKLRFSWQSHLKICADCRREKEMLLTMMERIKYASPSPSLSVADANAMVAQINHRLAVKRKQPSLFAQWIQAHRRLIPAATAVCLLLIAVGIFWPDYSTQQFGRQAMNTPVLEETIGPEEIDIITNFELLRELDSLEKLVQVVDYTEPNSPSTIERNNSHGSIFYENNILYS